MEKCKKCKFYCKLISDWCNRVFSVGTCEEERHDENQCGLNAKFFDQDKTDIFWWIKK